MSIWGPIGDIVGGFFSGEGRNNELQAQYASATYNEAKAHEQAINTTYLTDVATRGASIEAAKTMGSIRAAYGASGVKSDGTPQAVMEDDAAFMHDRILNMQYRGYLSAKASEDSAKMYLKQLPYINQAKGYNWVSTLLGTGGSSFNSTWSGGGGGGNSGGGVPDVTAGATSGGAGDFSAGDMGGFA